MAAAGPGRAGAAAPEPPAADALPWSHQWGLQFEGASGAANTDLEKRFWATRAAWQRTTAAVLSAGRRQGGLVGAGLCKPPVATAAACMPTSSRRGCPSVGTVPAVPLLGVLAVSRVVVVASWAWGPRVPGASRPDPAPTCVKFLAHPPTCGAILAQAWHSCTASWLSSCTLRGKPGW